MTQVIGFDATGNRIVVDSGVEPDASDDPVILCSRISAMLTFLRALRDNNLLPEFKMGDVVALKSGSPEMTIVDDCGTASQKKRVSWFMAGIPHVAEFPDAALRRAKAPKP